MLGLGPVFVLGPRRVRAGTMLTDSRPVATLARRTPPAALLAAGMACFGSATPVSRVVGRSFPVWLGSGLRLLVAAAVLIPALHASRRAAEASVVGQLRRLSHLDRWRVAAIAVVGTFLFTATLMLGMQRAPGAVGAIVMATTPAVTGVGAVLFLGDRWRWSKALAIGLAVIGVALVNLFGVMGGGGSAVVVGSLLVFAAVLCEATYSLVGKRLTADLTPLAIATLASVVAVAVFAPLALFDAAVRMDWAAPTVGEWVALLWWGAGSMALGSLLWFSGMRQVEGSTAAAFMGVMPVSALVLSYVLLAEPFRLVHLLGMAVVLGGLAVVVRTGGGMH